MQKRRGSNKLLLTGKLLVIRQSCAKPIYNRKVQRLFREEVQRRLAPLEVRWMLEIAL